MINVYKGGQKPHPHLYERKKTRERTFHHGMVACKPFNHARDRQSSPLHTTLPPPAFPQNCHRVRPSAFPSLSGSFRKRSHRRSNPRWPLRVFVVIIGRWRKGGSQVCLSAHRKFIYSLGSLVRHTKTTVAQNRYPWSAHTWKVDED